LAIVDRIFLITSTAVLLARVLEKV